MILRISFPGSKKKRKIGGFRSVPLFPFLLYFLLSACASERKGPPIHIEKGDSLLRFGLSNSTYSPLNVSIFEENDKKFIINQNFSRYDTVNHLEVYDLKSEGPPRRIDPNPETFGYFDKINEYQYLSHDSILFSINGAQDPWITHFVMIDGSGRMLDRWSVDGSTDRSPDFRTGGTVLFPPIHYRDSTIFTPHLVEGTDLDGSVFDTAPMAMIHPSDSDAVRIERFGRYPDIYIKGDREYLPDRSVRKLIPYPLNLYDYAIGGGELVLSFPACDTLYRYKLDGDYLGKKAVESKLASPQDLWSELRNKGAAIQENYEGGYADLPHYTSMTYDPHRKLYYRMLRFGERWALMVLSEDLELLEEVELDQEGPFLTTPLPTEDRILIRKNKTEDLVFLPMGIERTNGSPTS